MEHLDSPALSFLFDMELQVEAPYLPGQTPKGNKRIIRVSGGTFQGELLKGEVVPGGDDWITVREDGTIIQDVRILLKTDDEALIMMTYRGIRTGRPEVLERLDNNEDVDPSDYYFRTAPTFETSSAKYHWLNNRIVVSTGKRMPGKVNYSVYVVD
ncbi:DUF3237 domain-containing protein [Tuberibacillus sp. Marseille-P3662]|uniref:DUF3237 domain-containing protein n=1 Tax=Tuberibacillus sp. Marseille-P3662 TaxID=1965358 RepID=UPI000A1CE4FD|nr:DUF3237 domain-containing protein [Tuberibacillus sp. Marseille-P3662]